MNQSSKVKIVSKKQKIVSDWKFHGDGSVYKIVLDSEDGDFSIYLEGYNKVIKAKTLDEVRQEARKWMELNSGVEFLPVIVIEAGSCFSNDKVDAREHNLQFKYERAFSATRKDGVKVWRHWDYVDDIPDEKDANWNDSLEGRPGHVESRSLDETEIEIPYTKEKWLALRQLTKMIRAISIKLIEIREGGTMEKFLLDIFKKGVAPMLEFKGK